MGLLDTPVNAALALYIVYGLKQLLLPPLKKPTAAVSHDPNESYNWMPRAHPPTVLFRTFTPKTLAQYNGEGGERILLAINGRVFDVTAGRSFYGPGGPYGNFAGRDASRGMAKQSFELDMLTPIDQPIDKLEGLTPSEIENMTGWLDYFMGKYIHCGELVENTD